MNNGSENEAPVEVTDEEEAAVLDQPIGSVPDPYAHGDAHGEVQDDGAVDSDEEAQE